MASLFERLGRPQPVKAAELPPEKEQPVKPETVQRGPLLRPIVPHATQNDPPLDRMLDWLVNHWSQPVIDVRTIITYGPRPRNRKKAISLAETLAANGWLEPLRAHRRDRKVWRIARGPYQPGRSVEQP